MAKNLSTQTTTIASGATTSAEIDLTGKTLYGISMPAAFTGTTLTFTASPTSGGTFQAVYGDDGTQISITVAASRYVALNNKHLALRGCRYLKLVSGSSEGQADTLTLHVVDE